MKRVSIFISILLAIASAVFVAAQTPIAVRYTAATDNVGMNDSIRVELFRWSTDAEREQFLDAWKAPAAPAPSPDNAPPAAAGRGGRGGGAARGGAPAPAVAPAAPSPDNAPPAAGGRGGRGGAAARGGAPARGAAANRGGRGDAGGAAPEAAPARTPESALAAALAKAPTVGRIWSSESAGYSVRYAVRLPQPDGGERIVLVTDRRLSPDFWKPASGTPTNYEFSLIEARVNSKGAGEARSSLTGKVTIDATAGTLALESYAGLPVILKNLQRQ